MRTSRDRAWFLPIFSLGLPLLDSKPTWDAPVFPDPDVTIPTLTGTHLPRIRT